MKLLSATMIPNQPLYTSQLWVQAKAESLVIDRHARYLRCSPLRESLRGAIEANLKIKLGYEPTDNRNFNNLQDAGGYLKPL